MKRCFGPKLRESRSTMSAGALDGSTKPIGKGNVTCKFPSFVAEAPAGDAASADVVDRVTHASSIARKTRRFMAEIGRRHESRPRTLTRARGYDAAHDREFDDRRDDVHGRRLQGQPRSGRLGLLALGQRQ